jgi:hypothetical protein
VSRDPIRRRCQARLQGVRVPRPFDVQVLCEWVAADRGRPIRLVPMSLPGDGPCGLWIATERSDYIVFEERTSRLHQEHIIVHELAHLICRHTSPGPLPGRHLDRLFATLDLETVRRVLSRAGYSSEEEREAEMFASLVLGTADRRSPRVIRSAAADAETAASVARLESTLGR